MAQHSTRPNINIHNVIALDETDLILVENTNEPILYDVQPTRR